MTTNSKSFVACEADVPGLRPHWGMGIYRYTGQVQSAIGCKLKAEPWMHIAFFGVCNEDDKHKPVEYYYVIYIWDTRQILAEGTCSIKQRDDVKSAYASDNHKYLKGTSEGAQRFNASVTRVNQPKQKKPSSYVPRLKENILF